MRPIHCVTVVFLMVISLTAIPQAKAEAPPAVRFQTTDGHVAITVDEKPIATYVYDDPTQKIPRPYFAHVKAPCGIQVTRNHPPVPGQDRTDHDTMHPGIWMAFGDLDGVDFWRNKAKVVHRRFVKKPRGAPGSGSFVEDKQYLRPDNSVICSERFRCQIHVRGQGYLLIWDSTFRAEHEFYFGDQEEMGLGLRVATPLSELKGGQLSDSNGRQGAKVIWSQSANWCDYSGVINGQRIGMTLMCHPQNIRPSWMHARDYGFVAANLFGRQAMHKGPPSKVRIKPGETLRLRYAVWIHSTPPGQQSMIAEAYAQYLTVAVEGRSDHPVKVP